MNPAVERAVPELVELRVPCRPEWVALARLAAATVANRLSFSLEEIEDVKLAVAEACTAVIQHGGHGEFIDLTCEALSDSLRVRVHDSGRHGSAANGGPAMTFDEARVAGLGIFLIRTLMDEVSYDVHPQLGTDLLMIKRLAPGS
ncbi:MAG: ATP-binding protein [Candidatus Eremiobacteraeota bacterium]|nr:ATP-binding protein [Candidatus Eremiobacteraeota bacterium]MBV9263545.1 ATP-binding protein [Candidatus Eremiobacteraeota bacterium]